MKKRNLTVPLFLPQFLNNSRKNTMEQNTTAPVAKKHPNESVLALHKTGFAEIMNFANYAGNEDKGFYTLSSNSQYRHQEIASVFNQYVTIGNRVWLENDPTFKQIIPYCAIVKEVQVGDGKEYRYLTYRRVKGSGEARLLGSRSIGIGGHLNVFSILDVFNKTGNVNFIDVIHNGASRELSEEINLHGTEEQRTPLLPVGILYNEKNDVSKVHVGIAGILVLPENATVTANEDCLELGEWLNANQILSLEDNEQWTIDFMSNDHVVADIINAFKMYEAEHDLKQAAALTKAGFAAVEGIDTEYDAQKETDAQQAQANGLVVETALVDGEETFVNVSADTPNSTV